MSSSSQTAPPHDDDLMHKTMAITVSTFFINLETLAMDQETAMTTHLCQRQQQRRQ